MKFPIALLVASLVVGRELPVCDKSRIRARRNIRTMPSAQVERYFSAVKQLNSGPKPTRWDSYALLHRTMFSQIHGTPLFLAWHRMMLYFVEKDLQKIDPSVTIPYWDWSESAQTPTQDPALSKRMFGTSGHGSGSCVTDGKFNNFTVFYWSDGHQSQHCLIRRPDIFQRPFTTSQAIDRNYLDLNDIAEFGEAIEGVPHGSAHNNIGGEFSTVASAGDPLFYSHHAFVDKLWFDWQNRHREKFHDYPINPSQNLSPWNIPIQETLDPASSMCYQYPQERFLYRKPAQQGRAALRFTPEKYNLPQNLTHAALMAHARRYILRGLGPAIRALDLRIPEPLPVDFLFKMHYNIAKIREQERKDALLMAFTDPDQE
ncbi:hypothetical protein DSO57_1001076 [Entomophthora muscae]|uniref:Uncharacterized protein n=1 Tax=Entomophthora muscae TaxID=34485 RepID=A0ACC2RP36_9FUNG|nr:hypothetical protein DSO57_1001076 [Entomophthora muscae]